MILVGVVLAVFMLMLDATVTTVALPAIGRDLGADLADLQWVLNAYTIAMAAVQLTAGALADRFGRRRLFLLGVAGFAAASLACGLAASPGGLIAARAAQGLAGAVLFATTLALIGQSYTGPARGTAFAVRGMTAGVAVVLGPVVGGLVTDALGWRWVFLLNLPVAAAALAIGAAVLPRRERLGPGRIDVAGAVLWAVALVALLLGISRGGTWVWAGVAAVAFAAFVAVEARRREPMLDLRMFADGRFVGTQLSSFAVQAGFFGLLVYLSVYFQDHLGQGVLRAGLSFLPIVIPIMLAGAVAGALQDRVPPRVTVAGALALIGIGLLLMYNGGSLVPGMVVCGIGCGVALPALGSLAVDVAPERIGLASGVNNTALQLGMALGIAGYGAMLQRTDADFAGGLHRLFAVGAAVTLAAGALAAVLLRRRRPVV
jgi:EmrB/QacA subfamily drug resistance transporter